jgi:GNAT superfamily N-acetyltransferase
VVDVVPMEKTHETFEFALAVKKEALGPHIMVRWGWDEELQRKTHSERWATRRYFRIVRDGDSIGTVSIDEESDHVVLAEFYLLPPFHRKGIGTEVLARVLSDASAKHLPVRLQVLKWNPALSLYKRHGFVVTGETDTHFQMERAA